MSSSKTAGNLRDFRIDSRPSAPPSVKPKTSAPQQALKPRASSVTEWEQESSGFDAESLWKTWEEDLDAMESPVAKAPVRSAPSVPQVQTVVAHSPLRPTQSRETLRRDHQPSLAVSKAIASLPPAPQETLEEEVQVQGPMPWAAQLAHTERRMERLGEVEYSNSFKKQEMLKSQTAEFMAVLRHEFARQIETFNEARQSGAQAVHLYRITNTENDFMLFRNGVKLVVSGQRSGRILLAFNQFLGQIYASNQNPNFELEAQWNAFEQLQWTYRNERVQVQDIIRFFLSEFIRQSYK